MEEKKVELNPFLANLKKALEKGEPNESTQRINEVDDQSKNMSAAEASDRLGKRIEEVGHAESVTKEEFEKRQEQYVVKMNSVKKEEEKWLNIADIENMVTEIESTKEELEIVISQIKKKYASIVTEQTEQLASLRVKFKSKYGQEEYEERFGKETTETN